MVDLYTSVMGFKGRLGSNGFPANSLLVGLMEHSSGRKPLSHTLFRERMDFVQERAQSYFLNSGIRPMSPYAMDNGWESLVLDCRNDHVLKLRRGRPYQRMGTALVLQPCHEEYNQELDINYSVFPIAEDKRVTIRDIVRTSFKAAYEGFIIHNPASLNFGFVRKRNTADPEIALIDYGAIQEGKGTAYNYACAAYFLAKQALVPLYKHMPFIHPYWRSFRINAQTMLGMSKDNTGHHYEDRWLHQP